MTEGPRRVHMHPGCIPDDELAEMISVTEQHAAARREAGAPEFIPEFDERRAIAMRELQERRRAQLGAGAATGVDAYTDWQASRQRQAAGARA